MTVEDFEQHRGHLFAVAYRLLGEVAAAEDAVQEAFLRYQRAGAEIRDLRAWLTTVVTRLCLDELRSARTRREQYVGPWLPEPLVRGSDWAPAGAPDPAEEAEQLESLSMAMLVVLESLSPLERTVFVLREVFGYEYGELAEILGKSQAAVRQLAHRSREHVQARRPRFEPDPGRQREALEQLLLALASGNLRALIATLAEDAELLSDGGGLVPAARRPVIGQDRVARFLTSLAQRYSTTGYTFEVATVNGAPGVVMRHEGAVDTVLSFDVVDGKVARILAVRNPAKLRAVRLA